MHLAPYRRWLPLTILIGSLVALMETGLIFYSARLVDLLTRIGPVAFWESCWPEMLAAALFLLVLRPALIGSKHFFLDQLIASNLPHQVRWQAHRHLLGHAPSFFQNDFAGRLAARVVQIGTAVESSVFLVLEGMWFALVYFIGAVLVLAEIDARLGAPLLAWLGLYILYVRYMGRRIVNAAEGAADAQAQVSGRLVDAYSNIETIKLFGQGALEEAHGLEAMQRSRRRYQEFRRLLTELSFGMNFLNGVMIVGVVGPAVWLWTAGIVSIGQVAAALALTIRLNGMSGWIMDLTTRFFEQAGVMREGLKTLTTRHEIVDRPDAPPLSVARGEIRLEGVSHHYGAVTRSGLNEIDLIVPAGQRVGLVGRSGAGKSTLVKLLLRLHDLEAGRILIDGQPIDAVAQESLRRQIGVVTQDLSLLHRSIRDNILYGRPDASEIDMIQAARAAEAHDFILQLCDSEGRTGYDAHVGERGLKLSGGQRQRISMARVILKDAPILVLDEATSALDSEVEAAILRSLDRMMQGKTVIAIAHRLSTITRMDRIVVLNAGRIAEDGSHEALLRRGGLYADLYARQSGGFIADGPAPQGGEASASVAAARQLQLNAAS